jgi:hypothetical protein
MIDRVVSKLGRRLCEVPVGFKWFVPGLFDRLHEAGQTWWHKSILPRLSRSNTDFYRHNS